MSNQYCEQCAQGGAEQRGADSESVWLCGDCAHDETLRAMDNAADRAEDNEGWHHWD